VVVIFAHVPRKTIQEYIEKVNAYNMGSSNIFEVPVSIPIALVITHIENVEANVMSYDAIVVTKDDNDDANVVTHDSIVVTNGKTISINETHITPPPHSLKRDMLRVYAPLRMSHAPYT